MSISFVYAKDSNLSAIGEMSDSSTGSGALPLRASFCRYALSGSRLTSQLLLFRAGPERRRTSSVTPYRDRSFPLARRSRKPNSAGPPRTLLTDQKLCKKGRPTQLSTFVAKNCVKQTVLHNFPCFWRIIVYKRGSCTIIRCWGWVARGCSGCRPSFPFVHGV